MMKNILRQLLPEKWKNAYKNAREVFRADQQFMLQRMEYDEKNIQGIASHLMNTQYSSIARPQELRSSINQHEFKIYSQNKEDGILLHLFSKIGVTNRTFVEFGLSDGRECNSANLSLNFGWNGLLIEADKKIYERAVRFYQSHWITKSDRAARKIVHAYVTAENINELLKTHGVTGEIDLLSIDIDGNDYWVWKAINAINPRVVVTEYNGSLGYTNAISAKYAAKFERFKHHNYYHGMSLPAAEKLGKEKGYVLVGCDTTGCNAFFVRRDLAGDFVELSAAEAYYPHSRRSIHQSTEEQFAEIKDMPWCSV